MGRQWWNRDDGFGLCHSCIDDCHAGDAAGVKLGDTHESYGVRGHHYDLESFAETMKLKTNET